MSKQPTLAEIIELSEVVSSNLFDVLEGFRYQISVMYSAETFGEYAHVLKLERDILIGRWIRRSLSAHDEIQWINVHPQQDGDDFYSVSFTIHAMGHTSNNKVEVNDGKKVELPKA